MFHDLASATPQSPAAELQAVRAFAQILDLLERIPIMWKRSLHVGSNWHILAD
jgi:hypothetical protein